MYILCTIGTSHTTRLMTNSTNGYIGWNILGEVGDHTYLHTFGPMHDHGRSLVLQQRALKVAWTPRIPSALSWPNILNLGMHQHGVDTYID